MCFRKQLTSIASNYSSNLFTQLAGPVDANWFERFDVNFRLRTLFTIPEVFQNGVVAANYLQYDSIAAAGSIAADESGVERMTGQPAPERVHSLLLNTAFDFHGKRAFDLPALPIQKVLAAMRTMHRLELCIFALPMPETLQSVFLGGICVSGLLTALWDEESETLGPVWQQTTGPVCDPTILGHIRDSLYGYLLRLGVVPQTVNYCRSQLDIQRSLVPAHVLGRAAMHEHLADTLLESIERHVFKPFCGSHYSLADYEHNVAPYFKAHRDDEHGHLVEQEHAIRLETIIGPFIRSKLSLASALKEAERFAQEQHAIWQALAHTPKATLTA